MPKSWNQFLEMSEIRNPQLWESGELKIEWVRHHMPLLEEVGKEFNVTRERIRQIEAKALRKLRHPSRSRKLKDYLDY